MPVHPSHYFIKTSVIPVGDWHYPQTKPTGGQIVLKAQSWQDLITMVRTFRLNNNIEIGDPAADVSNYTRINSPDNDTTPNRQGNFVASKAVPITPLAEKMKDHLVKLETKQVTLIGPDEVDRRAKICEGCSQNIPWETSCGECNINIRYKGNIVRQKASYANDDKLRGCRLHGIYLPTAVFLDVSHLPKRSDKAPSNCYLQ